VINIDTVLTENVEQYMCKKQCQCDQKGLENLHKWKNDQITEMSNSDIYHFNGKIKNFYECYQELQRNMVVSKKDQISDNLL